jgi:carboxyl-terminal processing protease
MLFFRRSAVLALLGLATLAPAVQAQAPLPSAAERAYIASRIYAAVQLFFAHWDDAAEADVDAAYRAYLESALAAEDRLAFTLASHRFLATLRNGHTAFLDREILNEPIGTPLDFRMRVLEGRWVVTESRRPDLRPGDIVTRLDGQEMEAFYQERRKLLPASTEQWARHVMFSHVPGFFSGGLYFPPVVTLTLADGRQVVVDRRTRGAVSEPELATEGRWLAPGRIAYIRVPSWAQPRFEQRAVELLEEFRTAGAIVVDVRGNSGGSTPVTFTSMLMDRPYRWWAESTPLTLALHRYYAEIGQGDNAFRRPHLAWPSQTMQPAETPFAGRVILLVDGACNSACEDFVMPFKDNGRATIIGETTAGSTGQPYLADLGHGMMAIIGAKREAFPDGARFEGVGIRPDIEITPRLADIRAGRDPVLDRALRAAAGR